MVIMSDDFVPIGYGSLFLPTSVMRVDDTVGKAKPKYQNEMRYGDRNILRDKAVESWAWREKEFREQKQESMQIVPVKIDGFKRKYSLETDYGGAMLDIEEDQDSWMNAVVISGLSEDEKEILDSSESSYETQSISLEDVEPYLEEHREVLQESFEDNCVEVYIGEPKTTDRTRNQTYHDRIRTGMDFIEELYGQGLGKQMWQDFKDTTHEKWVLESSTNKKTEDDRLDSNWSTVRRNDQITSAAEMHGYQI